MVDSPSNFLCSITHEIMSDPMVDPEGNNYERSAIENWLKEKSTSPVTDKPLTVDDLHPNETLRASIDEYRKKQSVSRNGKTAVDEPSFEIEVQSSWLNDYVQISIRSTESVGIRAPCDICCVVDISGSMGTEVTIQSGQGVERSGLNRLDVAKHALKTIVHSLLDNDRLAVVAFDDSPKTSLPLTQMDDDGRSKALAAIEALQICGGTNLWDGLKGGLDVLTEGQRTKGSNAALFLLTDGCPTDSPPGGHLAALIEYKSQTNFTSSVNTFGFGYDLQSQLLESLSQIGNSGSYAFIPDGSFVGTVFVNAITNLLTTTATNLKLSLGGIQPPIDPTSNYICHYATGTSHHKFGEQAGLDLDLGSLIFSQSRDIVIPLTNDQYKSLELILDYQSPFGEKSRQCKSIKQVPADEKLLNEQKYRLQFVDVVRKGYALLREATLDDNPASVLENLQNLEKDIQDHSTDDKYLTDLLADLTGQVKEAFSRQDWFRRWGCHYLLSLTRAHLFQQCNNFKDIGVQHYGQGELFSTIRDEMDSIFCGLPAPVKSMPDAPASPIDMSQFYNSDDPCFHGSCIVKLLDGSMKFVKDIQRGDRLYPHGGTVNYILRTVRNNKHAQMVLLDTGLMITPWHPIRLDGVRWIFPCSLVSSPTDVICEAVYSFALDQGHTMWVNDIECVTLGHGFQEDIVRHRYYGTQRVIEDLRSLDGQQKCTGFIEIQSKSIVRNKRTGLVQKIRHLENMTSTFDQ